MGIENKNWVLFRRIFTPSIYITLKCWFKYKCKASPRSEIEITPFLNIGDGSVIGSFCKIKATDGPLIIGKNVTIGNNSFIAPHNNGIRIGNDCMIGPNASLVSVNYGYERLDIPMRLQEKTSKGITIGNDVWLSSGSVVLDGSEIGSGTIVTPNSVVSGKIPDNSIVQGNPGKIIFTRR